MYFFILLSLRLEKKPPLKTFDDVQTLLSQGKKREVKLLIRDNAWPINSTIRAQLWPAICSQHQIGKSMLEGYYWDMVNQVCTLPLCTKTRIFQPNQNEPKIKKTKREINKTTPSNSVTAIRFQSSMNFPPSILFL